MPQFKKVLLIDDDAITVTVCDRLMRISNFAGDVISCSDGKQAKEYLLTNIACLPQVILLDLQMGVMNGWEFLDWYETWSSSVPHCPPVYVLSSSLSHEDMRRSKSYPQVKGFIVKPTTVEHLNDITENVSRN